MIFLIFLATLSSAHPSKNSDEITEKPNTKIDEMTQTSSGHGNTADKAFDLTPADIHYLQAITDIANVPLDVLQNFDLQLNMDDNHPRNPPPPITPQPYSIPPYRRPTTPGYYDPYYPYDKNLEKKTSNAVALGLGIGIPLGIIATVIVVLTILWCRRRQMQRRPILPYPFYKHSNDYKTQLDSPAYSMHDPWILDRNLLEIDYNKKLGSGAFCNVFIGKINGEAPVTHIYPGVRTQNLVNCSVAVKMLPSFADDIARSDFMQEINFMKALAYHPHLVSMLGFVHDKKSPYLLVELCEKGDLLHLIRSRRDEIIEGPSAHPDGLKIKDLLMFSWQISNGLEYLNSIGCIHRDIAARNVLVDSSNTCKIGDFGLCRLTDSLLYTARGGRLPLKWMAPESLASFEYSFKSDVWSYGVLLWELFSLGEVPYADIQTTDLLTYHRSGKRLEKPTYCPNEIYQIMTSCCLLETNDRPSFQHICSLLAMMLESATENYGYLVPTSKAAAAATEPSSAVREMDEQCDDV
ncbi:unnamed protein product [Caenorhabditis bovis]|uniref:Protein kinase domain-containing protein n=1 Tax=Caenorhabditis bovis TaxID=2654633 RepID=A0A8S1EKY3_9PELO|nr:unnamed protein product [Caenorhabditis bovis]